MSATYVPDMPAATTQETPAVEVYPAATEVAVIYLPDGGTARVHLADRVRDYSPTLPDAPLIAVVPGDRELLGWGAQVCLYLDLGVVRYGHHRLDRPVWHAAVKALRDGGVVFVQYEQREYYGKSRWTAVAIRTNNQENQ